MVEETGPAMVWGLKQMHFDQEKMILPIDLFPMTVLLVVLWSAS